MYSMTKFLTLLLLLFTFICTSQSKTDTYESILQAKDTTWLKEIITFPIGFAPELQYEGYEDLRFAKNWSKPESPEFWTYTLAWNINLKKPLSIAQLETDLQFYYDGLMGVVNKDPDFKIPSSIIKLSSMDRGTLKGTIQVYDSFHSKKVITLHIMIEQQYCEEKQSYTPIFRVSIKDFDAPIWQELQSVKLRKDFCEL
tara:strand:- start:174477 stop:175073 length:597 start_codon:yes stop_codon:yes gene_type:complete